MAFPYMSAANRINIPREGGVEDQATLKAAPVREFMKETFLQKKNGGKYDWSSARFVSYSVV